MPCVMRFVKTWNHLLNDRNPSINVFSAVPTIYIKLIEHLKKSSHGDVKQACSDHIRYVRRSLLLRSTMFFSLTYRLFLSGSSALPESIFQKWHQLTGFEIVEQFGSSETGRVLSNKLQGKKLAGKNMTRWTDALHVEASFRTCRPPYAWFEGAFGAERWTRSRTNSGRRNSQWSESSPERWATMIWSSASKTRSPFL